MSYCTFLSFYLLMKVDRKDIKDHPVLYRLTHIKSLLQQLAPLDTKLQVQIDKLQRAESAQQEGSVDEDSMDDDEDVEDDGIEEQDEEE